MSQPLVDFKNAYVNDDLMEMVVKHPSIETEAWIDDITLEGDDEDPVVVEANMCKATKDLRKIMRDDCSLEFAEPKTAVVASRDGLAAAIASKVGDSKVPRRGAKHRTRILGGRPNCRQEKLLQNKKRR